MKSNNIIIEANNKEAVIEFGKKINRLGECFKLLGKTVDEFSEKFNKQVKANQKQLTKVRK